MSAVFVFTVETILISALLVIAGIGLGIMKLQDAMRRRRIAKRGA